MHSFPHHYRVAAAASGRDDVELSAAGLAVIRSASPPEFDGPGARWSPETLLVGAVADCFVLTFRAVARASRLSWTALNCVATGTLDRIDGITRFTTLHLVVTLTVPGGTEHDHARRALERAERGCLITNSLSAAVHLEARIEPAADLAGTHPVQ